LQEDSLNYKSHPIIGLENMLDIDVILTHDNKSQHWCTSLTLKRILFVGKVPSLTMYFLSSIISSGPQFYSCIKNTIKF